jgi:uncharacterized protein
MVRQPGASDGSPREPQRMCVGCRQRDDRSVLLRVVAGEVDGIWSVVPDPHHRLAGRGASVHRDPDCLELAVRRRAFTRALRSGVALDPAPVRAQLAPGGPPEPSEPEAGQKLMSTR